MGTPAQRPPRFKINPVELFIFSTVTLIFANSVYHLIYDHEEFHAAALTPMSSSPVTEKRIPAAVANPPQERELTCAEKQSITTSTEKIRLTGSLCGISPSKLLKATAEKRPRLYTATIIPHIASGKFSTDYIPLEPGENLVRLEFLYHGGKAVSQQITVTRNNGENLDPEKP